jgi:hypothetical protein
MATDLPDAQFIENLEIRFEHTLNRALPVRAQGDAVENQTNDDIKID